MKTISPDELQKLMASEPQLPLLDVRTRAEFAEVHVPQARNIPLDELQPGALPFDKERPVYLICRTQPRAMRAAESLAREGFTQLVVIAGGTLAWVEAHLPVKRPNH
jgi:rhodanese-related sulfurtransferase